MSAIHFAESARASRPYCGTKARYAHPQVTVDLAAVTCSRCILYISRWSDTTRERLGLPLVQEAPT